MKVFWQVVKFILMGASIKSPLCGILLTLKPSSTVQYYITTTIFLKLSMNNKWSPFMCLQFYDGFKAYDTCTREFDIANLWKTA